MLGRSAADPNLAAIQALLGGPQKSRYSFAQPQVKFTTPRQPISQGSLAPQKRSIGQYLEDKAGDVLRSAGVAPHNAARFAHKALGAFNDLTPVGNVTGAQEGYGLLKQGVTKGDVATGALGLGSLMLSILPGASAAKKPLKSLLHDTTGAIRAWHGSPHDFDRFDMSKIGTGEGAQAYGHGLYFAESPEVAKSYASQGGRVLVADGEPIMNTHLGLGKNWRAHAAHELLAANGDETAALAAIARSEAARKAGGYGYYTHEADKVRDEIAALRNAKLESQPNGRLYEVNINAEPEDFLDWDRLAEDQADLADKVLPNFVGQTGQLYNDFTNSLGRFPGDPMGRAKAPQELIRRGIPGIRYLDQGSRQTGGTSNYVVFDDKLIDILNKF